MSPPNSSIAMQQSGRMQSHPQQMQRQQLPPSVPPTSVQGPPPGPQHRQMFAGRRPPGQMVSARGGSRRKQLRLPYFSRPATCNGRYLRRQVNGKANKATCTCKQECRLKVARHRPICRRNSSNRQVRRLNSSSSHRHHSEADRNSRLSPTRRRRKCSSQRPRCSAWTARRRSGRRRKTSASRRSAIRPLLQPPRPPPHDLNRSCTRKIRKSENSSNSNLYCFSTLTNVNSASA